MRTIIKNMADTIKAGIVQDMGNAGQRVKTLSMLIHAYNQFREDDFNGADYIFNLHRADDLKCCIDAGMSAGEIAELYSNWHGLNYTEYFSFSENTASNSSRWPHQFPTTGDICDFIRGDLDALVMRVICYPYVEAYKPLWVRYVSDYMIDEDFWQ